MTGVRKRVRDWTFHLGSLLTANADWLGACDDEIACVEDWSRLGLGLTR
jgi:hypothetical protein